MKIRQSLEYKVSEFLEERTDKYFLKTNYNEVAPEIMKKYGLFNMFSKRVGAIYSNQFLGKKIVCYDNELFDILKDLDLEDDVTLYRK